MERKQKHDKNQRRGREDCERYSRDEENLTGGYDLGQGTNRYNGGNNPIARETAANGSSGGAGTMGSVVNAGTSESEGTARKKIQ